MIIVFLEKFFKNKPIFALACFFIFFAGNSWKQEIVSEDRDQDGFKETDIYLEKGIKISEYVDRNADGQADKITFYKKNIPQYSEIDVNGDGVIDSYIKYRLDASVAWVRTDLNNDTKPDLWQFLRDGRIYKKQWDKNNDGKEDLLIIYASSRQTQVSRESKKYIVIKKMDENYDGVMDLTQTKLEAVKEADLLYVDWAPGDSAVKSAEKTVQASHGSV